MLMIESMNLSDQSMPMNELVERLISNIRRRKPEIAEFLVRAYQTGDDNPVLLERTISFFTANSVLASAVLSGPGSSIVSELLYDQEYNDSFIDQYFYNSRGGSAVKGRLESMQGCLPMLIKEEFLKRKREAVIGSLGSGPGRYIIHTALQLSQNGYRDLIKAICFDIDENAVLRGKRLAEIHGVSDIVRFKRANMHGRVAEYFRKRFDVLILKGILCPYEASGCRTLLEHVKGMLKIGGILIASNVAKKMVKDDPFTCFIMNKLLNWAMSYKDEGDMQSIFESAGLKWQGCFTDSYGYHIMGVGRRVA